MNVYLIYLFILQYILYNAESIADIHNKEKNPHT